MRFSSGLKVFVIMSCMAIACLVLPGLAAASTYYVDPQTGNDSNPGTSQSSPWAHIPGDPAGGSCPTINGGDTIYVKSGASLQSDGAAQHRQRPLRGRLRIVPHHHSPARFVGLGQRRF